jgi:hypothetical protein
MQEKWGNHGVISGGSLGGNYGLAGDERIQSLWASAC